MIDIITLRGTGEPRDPGGAPTGMLRDITKLLDPQRFRCFEPDWPASVGPSPDVWGPSLDTSVRLGTAAGVAAIQQSPNVCGLLSYSLGSICASRILEGVRAGTYTNTDGSPLEIAFVVNFANPLRRAGESVGDLCPPDTFGLHGQRGDWPDLAVREYANPGDIITSVRADSPLRIIDVGISPFSFVEGARIGNVTPLIFAELLRFLLIDPLANAARYAEAVHGVIGYLTPWPDGEHVLYSGHDMPGTGVLWTTHAANYLNATF
ncbi:hypothetical protein IU438_25300 [Nocardia cyriacigeorgica]|uniref:hypothetical protein n=1 Tax=Nocardia cyriacigeorgica TaxID=135487 RepID=UPI001893CF39|nr:hypothetical protein [Nocardia cyriacigeorgica]MBF6089752.1 hypothetical protein [Nocardia cyriacigeorgica]MBF6094886.1 hypothetical protein [Nocardia cyriacigeorgica]MBF6160629.1 hypothetical protein [Nocardia cyriacigeorgica]MBF6199604.1 hypothetical protein [Nocardia cyriacigeorgica]MBF6320096.1 hypothetical protein [Nocardia cyriacigeorgica]